jgi:hypothetical protein
MIVQTEKSRSNRFRSSSEMGGVEDLSKKRSCSNKVTTPNSRIQTTAARGGDE